MKSGMKFAKRMLAKAFLAVALMGGVATAAEPPESPRQTQTLPHEDGSRTLSFKIATGVAADGSIVYAEDLTHTVTYFRGGKFDMAGINALLSDREAGKAAPEGMDPALLDLLSALKTRLEETHPGLDVVFHVISGYRSPSTNEQLRADPDNPYRSAVAEKSLHMSAKAIDIFVPGVSGVDLRDAAWSLQKGGVGFYPQFREIFPEGYIHVDTGRVRNWGFNK